MGDAVSLEGPAQSVDQWDGPSHRRLVTQRDAVGIRDGFQRRPVGRDQRLVRGDDVLAAFECPAHHATRGVHAAHEAVLFTYSALMANDSGLIKVAGEAIAEGKDPKEMMKAAGYKPDLKKRGSVRTVFDGRYKFSRYFAPVDRNRPATIDDLFKANDVELFDLQTDPQEAVNLAADRKKNGDLIAAMSAKLEAAIKAEIGVDNGREMPEIPKVTWYMDTADL